MGHNRQKDYKGHGRLSPLRARLLGLSASTVADLDHYNHYTLDVLRSAYGVKLDVVLTLSQGYDDTYIHIY